jgi:hypothetical protein
MLYHVEIDLGIYAEAERSMREMHAMSNELLAGALPLDKRNRKKYQ